MCGSSSQQNQIEGQQQTAYKTLQSEAGQVFGQDSSLFNTLTSGLNPIFEAGPDQQGFSAQELSNLNSQAITQGGQAYRNAAQAVGQQEAAVGGGNIALPSGVNAQTNASLASSAANNTANQLGNITQNNYAQGRANWLAAGQELMGAPSVMNNAAEFNNSATGAGTAAANTANQIAQQNQSWMGAVGGILGGVAGGLMPGGAFANMTKSNN